MTWSMHLITGPEREPVTLAEAKEHLAVTHDQHDAMILRLITAGRAMIEKYTGRAFMEQTWEQRQSRFEGDVELFRPPFKEMVSFKYFDRDEVEQTLDPAVYYTIAGGRLGRTRFRPINATIWPIVHYYQPQPIRITFKAGYGSGDDFVGPIPAEAVQAILLYVGHYYNNRDQVVLSNSREQFWPLPLGAEELLADLVDFYFA